MWHCGELVSAGLPQRTCTDSDFSLLQGLRGTCGTTSDEIFLTITFAFVLTLLMPFGLMLNIYIIVVNFVRNGMLQTIDSYSMSLCFANCLIILVAFIYMLGITDSLSGHSALAMHLPTTPNYSCATAYATYHTASLAASYSLCLMCFDFYIEASLPIESRPILVGRQHTPHICAFIWGGSLLASFPAILIFGCWNHLNCSTLRVKQLNDVMIFITAYLVPLVGVTISLYYISQSRRGPLMSFIGRPSLSVFCLLLATAGSHFVFWMPHYALSMVHLNHPWPDPRTSRLLRAVTLSLGLFTAIVTPTTYCYFRKDFWLQGKLACNAICNCLGKLCRPWQRQHTPVPQEEVM
uniref:probable G-protein coupled receptor 146 n=1 Tax=Myxine glutinosa TaxID=7769 RepID=UPI00358F9E09